MYDYIIIHGSYGTPFENWFPWLFNELSKESNVLAPQMPCGRKIQNFNNWARVLDSYSEFIDENTSFIGHSLSPAFIIDYILEKKIKVNNLYFAAPFYGLIDIPDFDEVNSPFFIRRDFSCINEFTNKRISFISKNDPYVPNKLSDEFCDLISSQRIYVENAGHFNTAAGYKTFADMLSVIKNK